MREIKFRCYESAKKIMYYHKDLSVLAKNIKDNNIFSYMQYTGLKDKNEVEIFEGDILQVYDDDDESIGRQVVKWGDDGAYWLEGDFGDYDLTTIGNAVQHFEYSVEVIGNIHQHPEILNSDK